MNTPINSVLAICISVIISCGQNLEKGSINYIKSITNEVDNERLVNVDDAPEDSLQSQQQIIDRWSRMADMHSAHECHSAVVVDGKLYALGGSQYQTRKPSEFEQYDPATNRWIILPNMPTPRIFLAAATIKNGIYAIGGLGSTLGDTIDYNSTVEMYDVAKNTWSRCSDLPTPRNRLAAVAFAGKIYVIGGLAKYGNTKVVEVYDPEEDTWDRVTDMPTARHGHSAVVVNGNIYVIGGYEHSPSSLVEQYDPTTDRWRRKADMPTERGFFGVAVVQDLVYALAGRVQGDPPIERYDPVKNEWTRLGTMPGGFRNRFGTAVVNGMIYVLGGEFQGDPETSVSVFRFDPEDGQ